MSRGKRSRLSDGWCLRAFGPCSRPTLVSPEAEWQSQLFPNMGRRQPKTAVVAFKLESDLAEFLNKLPNKSALIRKATSSQMGMAWLLCSGRDIVSRGVHDHYASLLPKLNQNHCDDCGTKLP